uniref:Uncharacterized protein n=1 Tax=Cyclopterus lumpus TaxID=8103 RepID=A0A8C2Z018_CYCLU
MWTRGLKVSCRYSSNRDEIKQIKIHKRKFTSPRLNFMFLQLVDLNLKDRERASSLSEHRTRASPLSEHRTRAST